MPQAQPRRRAELSVDDRIKDENGQCAPAPGVIVVRAGGAVLAESHAALEASSAAAAQGAEPIRLLPMEDASLFLDRTEEVKEIPGLGAARGYDIVAKSGPIPLAAWAVESPVSGAEALKDHVCFDEERVAVERL